MCWLQGQTALHVAVSEGYLDIVDALLAHHADPNAQDFMVTMLQAASGQLS